MPHTLKLELADDIYEPLAKKAKQTGSTPEKLCVDWLQTAILNTIHDPLENFIGSIHGNTSDWADKHDKHLGESILKKMRPEKEEGD